MNEIKVARELLSIAKELASSENRLFVGVTSWETEEIDKAKKTAKRLKGEIVEDGHFYSDDGDTKFYLWAKFPTDKEAKKFMSTTRGSARYLSDGEVRKYL